MLIKKKLNKKNFKKETYNITIGTFDAIHKGHQKVLTELVKNSLQDKCKSCVITFINSPKYILNKTNDKVILENNERMKIFKEFGINTVFLLKFDKKLANMTAAAFLARLYQLIHINKILIGQDFKFGYKNKGNINLLRKYQKRFTFKIRVIRDVKKYTRKISTSIIKQYIVKGQIEKANQELGRSFSLQGMVIKGKGIGKKIGFPTINLDLLNKNTILPVSGVYATRMGYKQRIYAGMTYIGINSITKKFCIETNLFDFNQNFYKKKISLFFIKKLRKDFKFIKLEDLKVQLLKDKKKAIKLLKNYGGY